MSMTEGNVRAESGSAPVNDDLKLEVVVIPASTSYRR